jgi:hypothetical protein
MSEKLKWKNLGGSFGMADGRQIKRNEVFEATEAEIPKAFRDIIRPLASLPKVEALIFKHRRYPEGENYDYDLAFESRFNGSTILNEKNRNYMDPGTWQMASKSGMGGLIKELEGQAERAVALLGTMDTELENRKVTARRQGAAEPTELPADLRKLKFETEARLDVTREELDYIRGILAKIEAREEKERDAKYLLTSGPGGAGKMRNGVLAEIDGQSVKVNRKGDLIIDCPKSPYHKMAVLDYKEHVVKPFQKWRSRPPTKEERELGPHAPPRGGGVAWEDLPPRPKGF